MAASSTVRGHLRGLEVLQALNRRRYSTALQISRDTGLPRATVYRLLATLIAAGFVVQPNNGEHYCVHSSVLSLSMGFGHQAAAVEASRSFVDRFSAEVGWPASVYVYDSGTMMASHVVRSQREFSYPRLGSRVPLLKSSPGRALLASVGEQERGALLEQLMAQAQHAGENAVELRQAERLIQDAASYGCGFRDQGLIPRTCSLAVPIRADGRPVAFITLVVMRAVMSINKAIDTYLPAAMTTANEIEQAISRGEAGPALRA